MAHDYLMYRVIRKHYAHTQRELNLGRKWGYRKTGVLPNGVLPETALVSGARANRSTRILVFYRNTTLT